MHFRDTVFSAAEYLEKGLEKWRWPFLLLFSFTFLASTLMLASAKLLWHDEISTSYLSRLPSLADIIAGLKMGVDSHPPLSFLLTRWSYRLLGVNPIAVRLPAILGYGVMTLCVFSFVRLRSNALYAAAASSLLLIIPHFDYAYEARPYGMILGFTGLSLLAWQRACLEHGGRRVLLLMGLTLALAGAVSTHYFAVLLWIPLCAGELARDFERKRIDWPVWLALSCGAVPLFLFLPLILRLRTLSSNYWARPSFIRDVEDTYRAMINLAMWPMIVALILWAVLKPASGREPAPPGRARAGDAIPVYEQVAAGCLAGFPALAVTLGLILGGYSDRYAIPGVVGLVIVLALLVYYSSSGDTLLGAILLVTFGGWFLLKLPGNYHKLIAQGGGGIAAAARPFDGRSWVAYAAKTDLPVVATNSVFYLQLRYYAPLSIAPRLYYLADLEAALHYDKYTTGDLVMLRERKVFSTSVEDAAPFLAAHRHFLMCVNLSQPTWLLTYLLDNGATLDLRARDDVELLFEVTLPKDVSG